MIVTDKLSTESFHAFIDEQLTDEQYVQVEAQLDEIPEKIEEIQQCHIINERLREVFDSIVEEPVPEDLYELALYGLGREQEYSDEEYTYEPSPYTDLDEDIAAIDSLDIFPEAEEENYIDDNDAADLELLAQTEHLSGFDIDSLRSDSSNIIPDIFDGSDAPVETEQAGIAESSLTDPTDDLLESIDTLSMELEKAHENNKIQSDQVTEESVSELDTIDEEDAGDLELEPEENEAAEQSSQNQGHLQFESSEIETSELENTEFENEQDIESRSAKEQVLETLTPEEELTLEPLEEQANDAFIQQKELSPDQEDLKQDLQPRKPSHPRNLRADLSRSEDEPKSTLETKMDAAVGSASSIPESTEFETRNKISGQSEDALPEDLVAEFFAPDKGPDFEVNEVVRQFEEVSDNFAETTDDHFYDESPVANLKYRALDFVDSINVRINDFKAIITSKKEAILQKFYGGQSITDFNKSPFDSYSVSSSSRSSVPADTLDLGAFEDAARESMSSEADLSKNEDSQEDQQPFFTADADINVAEGMPSNGAADSAMASTSEENFSNVEMPEISENKKANDDFAISEDKPEDKSDVVAPTHRTPKPEESLFNMDIGLDNDAPAPGNLVNRFGDTLRLYKQKIAEMRAGSTDTDPFESVDTDSLSVVEKNKLFAVDFFQKLKQNNNLKFGVAAALVVLLSFGIIVFSFTGGSSQKITNDRMEKLAIDAHLLNNQFNSKIIPDADSAIIEKLQWFSARIGRPVRLGDIKIEDFEFKKVTIVPTMSSFAATNIFENKAGQRMTLMAIPDIEGVIDAPISCRIPSDIDGLCVWVKDSVRYIAVANLSLSRVRSFSEQIIENI